jgi:type III secretion system low calcium response chaperone LcrH/SycD
MSTNAAAFPQEKLAEQVAELMQNGGTLGDVYNYDERDYEALYALGHGMYSQGRYMDAVKAFGFLVVHNHLERRFINAYAASLQMIKRHEEAISYYSLASVMDMSDPAPTFHSCECLIALGRVTEGFEGLGMVVRQCTQPEHAALKDRATALRELIEKQAAGPKGEKS